MIDDVTKIVGRKITKKDLQLASKNIEITKDMNIAISNILKNKLDQQVTAHSTDARAKSIKASAYIRDSKEYSSDMEVNYA
jgi:ethanolamine utilization protein EutA (predicted chaperonin)